MSYGTWWDPADPDRKVSGQLSQEGLRSPVLSLLDAPPKMWAGQDLSSPISFGGSDHFVPMLHGKLADQGAVTLLGCSFGGMKFGRTETHQLRVSQVVTGVWLDDPDERWFRRVEAELPALASLLGDYPVRPERRLSSRQRRPKLVLDDRAISWRHEDIEATFRYAWEATQGRAELSVRMRPVVVLTSALPRSLGSWISEWVVPINTLVSTATGARSNPSAIGLWHKKNMAPLERARLRVPLTGRGIGESSFDHDRTALLIYAPAIDLNPGGLRDVLDRLRGLEGEQEVFLSLLRSVINSKDRPERDLYLELTSALEAFHVQRYGMSKVSQSTFHTQRARIMGVLKDAALAPDDHRFLKRWLANRPSESLETRLRALARSVDELDSWTVHPPKMGQLRNDIAHGNAHPDPHELGEAYQQAFRLSRLLVLDSLGIRPNPT